MANLGLALMPMTELTIEDTWFMAGMKGTGSNTILAKDVFVPEHRFLPYPAAFEGRYRTEFTDEAVYRVALVPVTVLILIGSQLGIARAALDHTIAYASKRGITHTNYDKQRESTGFQILVADAAMKIETANLHAFRAADDLDRASQAAGIRISPRGPESAPTPRWSRSTAERRSNCSSPPTARRAWPTRTGCSASGETSTSPATTRSPSGR